MTRLEQLERNIYEYEKLAMFPKILVVSQDVLYELENDPARVDKIHVAPEATRICGLHVAVLKGNKQNQMLIV
jgi:hypothetical protein